MIMNIMSEGVTVCIPIEASNLRVCWRMSDKVEALKKKIKSDSGSSASSSVSKSKAWLSFKSLDVSQPPLCPPHAQQHLVLMRLTPSPLNLFPDAATTEPASCAGSLLTFSHPSRSNIQRTSLRVSAGASFEWPLPRTTQPAST